MSVAEPPPVPAPETGPRPAGAPGNDAPPRPPFAQDWRRIARMGAVGAVGQIFISLSNMPVKLDGRAIIEGILSLGYLSLVVLPLAAGSRVGHQLRREGVPFHRPGAHEVVGGAACGVLVGGGLSLLAILIANFDLREPLVNWSPILADLLAFNRGTAFAVVIWLALGAAVGAAGGLLRVVPPAARRVLWTVVLTLFGAAVLESLTTDLAEGMGIEGAVDWFYAPRGGLTISGAIVLALGSAVLAVAGRGRIRQARARIDSLEGPARNRANLGLILATGAVLVILPMFAGKLTNELLANVGLFVLLALGLNIVVGLAGILDLGYVAFFAVGSYSAAVLTAATSPKIHPELPWFVALFGVVVLTGLVGLFIGAPVIRMRGDYLAIVTLGFGEIIRLLFLSDWLSGWFGGSQGITNIPGAEIFGLAEVAGTDPRSVFYLVLAFCAIAIYVSWRLERSRIGRAWMAVREDETVAEAMGINTVNVKLLAFVVGAMLGSFSGAIFSAKVGSVFPASFLILVSIVILVVVIFGGMGNIVGVIAGSAVLIGVLGGPKQPGLLAEFSEFKLLIYGALLVWMMLARPEGLIPSVRRTRELHQEELAQDAWLRGETHDEQDGIGTSATGRSGAASGNGSTDRPSGDSS
ncbi:branched-chain amino acid ABC transporter permease [Candidatus Poriferisodalis multihospitum]|uniref:branched-chain amino acid ABC transporter permease n=1 Tax=Candidatus Poriferisodalis multihospitum TaxID=2983191 RepID=UPI002B261D90|nr:branched-chain amino acid ABC transporter permease [Candidatus Poriferisodalis multihospitum]